MKILLTLGALACIALGIAWLFTEVFQAPSPWLLVDVALLIIVITLLLGMIVLVITWAIRCGSQYSASLPPPQGGIPTSPTPPVTPQRVTTTTTTVTRTGKLKKIAGFIFGVLLLRFLILCAIILVLIVAVSDFDTLVARLNPVWDKVLPRERDMTRPYSVYTVNADRWTAIPLRPGECIPSWQTIDPRDCMALRFVTPDGRLYEELERPNTVANWCRKYPFVREVRFRAQTRRAIAVKVYR